MLSLLHLLERRKAGGARRRVLADSAAGHGSRKTEGGNKRVEATDSTSHAADSAQAAASEVSHAVTPTRHALPYLCLSIIVFPHGCRLAIRWG